MSKGAALGATTCLRPEQGMDFFRDEEVLSPPPTSYMSFITSSPTTEGRSEGLARDDDDDGRSDGDFDEDADMSEDEDEERVKGSGAALYYNPTM